MKRTPRRLLTRSFWCGFFVHAFFTLFVQDWMGLERYVASVREHWVNISWLVWVPLIVLCFYIHTADWASVSDDPIKPEPDRG